MVDAGTVIYKAVGDEKTLTEYNETVTKKCSDHYSKIIIFDRDWSAMYTQLHKLHALGTVSYRWEPDKFNGSSYLYSNLIEVTINEPLQVVVCKGSQFYDGEKSGNEKAELVKNALGIPNSEGLMEVLGKQHKALLMEETEGEWELIFNRSHLESISHTDKILAIFEKSPMRHCTYKWRACTIRDQIPGVERSESMRYECDDICIEQLGGESELPSWLEDL